MTRHRIAPALAVLLALAGCGAGTARGPYAPEAAHKRDIARAEALCREALAVIAKEPDQAERLLREALGCDLFNGPAHNNLGVLLLKRDRLYDAAEEFEWARKLMPGHPEPRTNLAIVLDRGGKHLEAIDAANAALEARPGDLGARQCLALIQVREGLADAETLGHLDAIAQRSNDAAWRAWAEEQRTRLEGRLAADGLPARTR